MTLNYRLMMAEVAARAQAGALAAGRTRFGNGSRHTDWLGTVSVLTIAAGFLFAAYLLVGLAGFLN